MKLKEITSANVKTVRRTNIENPGESRMLNVRVSFDSQKKKKKKKKKKEELSRPLKPISAGVPENTSQSVNEFLPDN